MASDSRNGAIIPGMTTPWLLSSDFATDPTPIEQLRIEAGAAGDHAMVTMCDLALQDERGQLDEDRSAIFFAREKCARIIAARAGSEP
jgi:hypothetical protein